MTDGRIESGASVIGLRSFPVSCGSLKKLHKKRYLFYCNTKCNYLEKRNIRRVIKSDSNEIVSLISFSRPLKALFVKTFLAVKLTRLFSSFILEIVFQVYVVFKLCTSLS